MQEDFYSVQTEEFIESIKFKECRALIAAIFLQALRDAVSIDSTIQGYHAKKSAIQFIDKENKLFCGYCHLLNLNPEYLFTKMKLEIKRASKK